MKQRKRWCLGCYLAAVSTIRALQQLTGDVARLGVVGEHLRGQAAALCQCLLR